MKAICKKCKKELKGYPESLDMCADCVKTAKPIPRKKLIKAYQLATEGLYQMTEHSVYGNLASKKAREVMNKIKEVFDD
jgi:hypothetical protein